jgi:hypothetical protein
MFSLSPDEIGWLAALGIVVIMSLLVFAARLWWR